MNGIDDLRDTLGRHADDVVGPGSLARRTAVRHRIVVARRRRRAAAAGTVAAALAAIGGVALLPGGPGDGPKPAGPTVFGIDLPAQLASLGFTYDYAEHVSGDGRAAVDLEATDRPRLISWGTRGDDDRVTVRLSGYDADEREGADFADWTYVPAGFEGRAVGTVARGDVAVAVYALGEERPSGVTVDGVTFRDFYEGGRLLGATLGDPGQSDVTVEATAGEAGTLRTYFCDGGPTDAYLHVATSDGEIVTGGGCDDGLPIDAAAGRGTSDRAAGVDATTRLYVTSGEDGPVVDDPDLRLGLALYEAPVERRLGAGLALAETIEEDGHVWRLARVATPDLGPDGARVEVPALEGPLIARIAFAGAGTATVTSEVDGDRAYDSNSVGEGTLPVPVPLDARTVALVGQPGPLGDGTRAAFGFYVRAD